MSTEPLAGMVYATSILICLSCFPLQGKDCAPDSTGMTSVQECVLTIQRQACTIFNHSIDSCKCMLRRQRVQNVDSLFSAV